MSGATGAWTATPESDCCRWTEHHFEADAGVAASTLFPDRLQFCHWGCGVNPKQDSGLSAQRLDIYRSATTVAQLDGFRTEVRSYGGNKRGTIWKSGDADYDFRRGIMDLVGRDGTRYTRAEWSDDVASRIRRGLPAAGSPARALDMDETGTARRAARSEHEGKEVIKYDYEQVRVTRKHGRQVRL